MKPSGANVGGVKEMRKWGGEEGEREAVQAPEGEKEERKTKKRKSIADDGEEVTVKKVKKAKVEGESRKSKADKTSKLEGRKSKTEATVPSTDSSALPPIDASIDPSASAPKRKANVPAKEPVFEVIDVAKAAAAAKGEKVTRLERRLKERKNKKKGIEPVKKDEPVDLKSMFGGKTNDKDSNDDTGLGVGGW